MGMEVVAAMEETTAEAIGSSVAFVWPAVRRLAFNGDIAFFVSASIAFWDFLVPKVRPRVLRAERLCRRVNTTLAKNIAYRWEVLTFSGFVAISSVLSIGRTLPLSTSLRARTSCS